jgi:hypothetical protein
MAAFAKGSPEAIRLCEMWLNGTLSWSAKPTDVRDMFETLKHFGVNQFRTGFNRVRREAEAFMKVLPSLGKNKKIG